MTIVVLTLAVPPTVLATWDLVKRMQVKEKFDRLITWPKRKESEVPQTRMTIHLPNNIVVQLDHAKPEDILDALADLANKERQS